jgi:hypothetical protein
MNPTPFISLSHADRRMLVALRDAQPGGLTETEMRSRAAAPPRCKGLRTNLIPSRLVEEDAAGRLSITPAGLGRLANPVNRTQEDFDEMAAEDERRLREYERAEPAATRRPASKRPRGRGRKRRPTSRAPGVGQMTAAVVLGLVIFTALAIAAWRLNVAAHQAPEANPPTSGVRPPEPPSTFANSVRGPEVRK